MAKTDEMKNLETATAALYQEFARYVYAGSDFCGRCYSETDVSRLTSTPVRALDSDDGRVLLWEASDHWESADVYRHYLPRILEVLGPPWLEEDPFTEHLFLTIRGLSFFSWPQNERIAVIQYLNAVEPFLSFDSDEDRLEWRNQLAFLSGAA